MKAFLFKLSLGLLAVACLLGAQKAPDCADSIAALEQRVEAQRQLLWDWAGLIHYGSENTEVPKPKADENRVVFLGDEIQIGRAHV